MSSLRKRTVFYWLIEGLRQECDRLPYGKKKELAEAFDVSPKTIQRDVKQIKREMNEAVS